MAKIRLTKNELKKQKEALKRFNQYLPTLMLKKQQLQMEILKLHRAMEDLKKEKAYTKAKLYEWTDVFAEEVGIEKLVSVKEIATTTGNGHDAKKRAPCPARGLCLTTRDRKTC